MVFNTLPRPSRTVETIDGDDTSEESSSFEDSLYNGLDEELVHSAKRPLDHSI
jgi:hypothetical protein